MSLLNTFLTFILDTDIFYNNYLYIQFIIIYNKLHILNYLLIYPYLVYYIPLKYLNDFIDVDFTGRVKSYNSL